MKKLAAGLAATVFDCIDNVYTKSGKLDPMVLKCLFVGTLVPRKGAAAIIHPHGSFIVQ